MTCVSHSCNRCHRDMGMVARNADYVLCGRCVKAQDVYTPPYPERLPDFSRELVRRLEAERRAAEAADPGGQSR